MGFCNSSSDTLMKAGDAKVFTVNVVKESDGSEVDISLATAITYDLARTINDIPGEVLVEKTLGSGITILPLDAETNPNNSRYQITLDESDTADLLGDFYHESKVVDALGRPGTVFCSDNVAICETI